MKYSRLLQRQSRRRHGLPKSLLQRLHVVNPSLRILLQCRCQHRSQRRRQQPQIGLRRQMLHQNLTGTLTLKRHPPRHHFIQHNPQRVHVDFPAIAPTSHLGGHVIHRAHALRLSTAATFGNELAEAHVAHLDDTTITENVGRLQVAMHEAPVMQKTEPRGHARQPVQYLLQRHAVGMLLQRIMQALPAHILHHNPVIPLRILTDVEDRHQIGVLQIQTLRNSTQLHFQIVVQQFERDFLARIGDRIVDLAEPAAMNRTLDRDAFQRSGVWCECELHESSVLTGFRRQSSCDRVPA